jgi:L-alanine-DL-glutamate epimerase-like enolase superfamily enzyme
MRIKSVKAYAVELPQRVPYRMSVANYEKLSTVIVEIETGEGHVGIGQASITAPAYSPYGETLASAVYAVNNVLGPRLMDADPLAIELAHVLMGKSLQGNPSAKTAIDIALHDLSGKILGVPVFSLLGGPLVTKLPVLASIGYFPTEELVERSVEAIEQGYGALKLRVGESLEADMRNLSAVRERIGDKVPISVDFNQAMSLVHGRPDQAISYIRRLEEFDLESVEQPVAGNDFENMAAITAAIDTPIVADESVWTLYDAKRAIEMRACDIIKIKIVKTSGLLQARKIASLCEAAGMALVIGHGIAGVVQNAAEAHLAASLPNWKAPGEMNGYLKLARDVAAPLKFQSGSLELTSEPGLGVAVSARELRELALA